MPEFETAWAVERIAYGRGAGDDEIWLSVIRG